MLIIVKLGGEVCKGPLMGALARDIAHLSSTGFHVIVAHGAGPQINDLSVRLGLSPRIVGGRRVTDEATLEAVKLAALGVNAELSSALRAAGAHPTGIHDAVFATRRPPRVVTGAGPDPIDLGWVGDVQSIDVALLSSLLALGRVPVIPCIGTGANGVLYNINADIVATALACACDAETLALITSTPGVLSNPTDPSTRIPRLTVADARRAILDGTVTGGMIPKLEESISALADGVRSILILDRDLARAIAAPGEVGTSIVADPVDYSAPHSG